MSGPRCPMRVCSSRVRTTSSMPRWYPTAVQSAVASTARTCGDRAAASGSRCGRSRQYPSMRRCVCRVRPSSNRVSRCLPYGPGLQHRAADEVDRRGGRPAQVGRATSAWPPSARSNRSAVRRRMSPSGTGASRLAAGAGRAGSVANPAAASALPSGLCSAPSSTSTPSTRTIVSRPVCRVRTVVASPSAAASRTPASGVNDSDGPAAALEVEHERAVDEHDERAGLAAGSVPACAVVRRRRAATGHGSAAPYGFAGSVAASTTTWRSVGAVLVGGPLDHLGVDPQPVDRAGQRELRAAEALDEVPAAHLAALLERRRARGRRRRTGRRCPRPGRPRG